MDAQGYDGNTPLHIAVSAKFKDIVKLLLNAGADPYLENFDYTYSDEEADCGQTAVDLAEEHDDEEVVNMIPSPLFID